MKKLIILSTLVLASCGYKKPNQKLERCVITNVTANEHYGIVRPETTYTYETQCGYTVSGKDKYAVGDTIPIIVIDMKNYKTQ